MLTDPCCLLCLQAEVGTLIEEAKALTAKVRELEDLTKVKDDEIKILKKETKRLNNYIEKLLGMVSITQPNHLPCVLSKHDNSRNAPTICIDHEGRRAHGGGQAEDLRAGTRESASEGQV